MKAPEILDGVQIVENHSGSRAGWFGYRATYRAWDTNKEVNNQVVSWEHCRDRVQLINKNHLEKNGFYFYHRKGAGDKVMAFLHRIETMLKLREKSSFRRTDAPNHVLWIKLAPFWLHNLVRRSFLTFALRCGQIYAPTKDNFWECFQKNKYGKAEDHKDTTLPAIKLFLSGYTLYKGKPLHMFQGWFRLFHGKNEEQVKRILSRRPSKKTIEQMAATYS